MADAPILANNPEEAIIVMRRRAQELERKLIIVSDENARLKEILTMQHFRKDKRAAAMPNVKS